MIFLVEDKLAHFHELSISKLFLAWIAKDYLESRNIPNYNLFLFGFHGAFYLRIAKTVFLLRCLLLLADMLHVGIEEIQCCLPYKHVLALY